MTSLLSFSLLIIAIVIFSIGIIKAYSDNEPDYAWAHTPEKGYFKVYYILNDHIPNQGTCKDGYFGCHWIVDGVNLVHIPENPWRYHHSGCNIYTHEMLHAWGYNDRMIMDFFDCRGSQFNSLPHIGFGGDNE